MAAMDRDDEIRYDLLAEYVAPDFAEFVRTARAHSVPVGSTMDVLRHIHAVAAGSVTNGYGMAKAMGCSRDEARAHPATTMLFAISDYLGPASPLASEYRDAYDAAMADVKRRST